MTLTKTQISQLYVSIFGRASEGEGSTYWQTDEASTNMTVTADIMLTTDAAKSYFGSTLNDNQQFIEHIYLNTLGKTRSEDSLGIDYWISELNGGKTKGEVVDALITAAQDSDNAGDAQDQFNNKVKVSNYCADTIFEFSDFATFSEFIDGVTNDKDTVTSAFKQINIISDPPSPLPHDNVVIPSDLELDWVDNTEITSAPNKAIGQVSVTTDGKSQIGTGFMISPIHVLTNAHVLLDNDGNMDTNAEITFAPGLNGDVEETVSYEWQTAWVEKNFDSDLYAKWPDNDLGIIKLSQPIGTTTGYLKLESEINQDAVGMAVKSAGYSAGKIEQEDTSTPGQDYFQWEVAGTIDKYLFSDSVLKLSESMAVTSGASGSPIYYSQNNENYFTGVLAGAFGDMTVAAAMDVDSHNWILGILQQDGYYTDYSLV